MKAELGNDKISGRGGLFFSKEEKTFASMSFSEEGGGRMRLANSAGEGTVSFYGSEKGDGGVMLQSGPSGGVPVVSVRATGNRGGELYLLDNSEKVRLIASGDTSSSLTLNGYNSSITARAGDTGKLQIANGAGTVVVDIYQNTNNIGVVAVGPAGNGTAATLGNMGLAASALVGK